MLLYRNACSFDVICKASLSNNMISWQHRAIAYVTAKFFTEINEFVASYELSKSYGMLGVVHLSPYLWAAVVYRASGGRFSTSVKDMSALHQLYFRCLRHTSAKFQVYKLNSAFMYGCKHSYCPDFSKSSFHWYEHMVSFRVLPQGSTARENLVVQRILQYKPWYRSVSKAIMLKRCPGLYDPTAPTIHGKTR